jgi:phosphate uptake regulator
MNHNSEQLWRALKSGIFELPTTRLRDMTKESALALGEIWRPYEVIGPYAIKVAQQTVTLRVTLSDYSCDTFVNESQC